LASSRRHRNGLPGRLFVETEGGTDLFFHHTAVPDGDFDYLREGDQVDFTEGTGKRGACATDVRPVK
jgi:CspA family cold shock protein